MSAHNKTQFTYARINCVLKDSSCDTPLPKILMLAILATCASSSSTKRVSTYAIPWVREDFFLHFLTSPFPFYHTPNLGFWPKLAIH
ncbi:hypothetical protein H5410_021143 [Solanum commersonii]|uniref:Uncharacterized protein n=1 Tax=Solanum commersonii TaxID=4109 RepID=A0A9J5ZGA9_SOLCO|nr:hypothetical protein H5410_021143 [Solanum commersonii]